MRNERIVISRQRLLDEVWGYDPFSTTNTIEVFVSNLRRKLEAERRAAPAAHDQGSRLRPSRLGLAAPRCSRAQRAPVSASFDRLPIRVRLAGVSALLTFVILCAFALAIGSLTVQRIRSDFNREVLRHGRTAALAAARSACDPLRGSEPPLNDFASRASHAVIRILALGGQRASRQYPPNAPSLGPPQFERRRPSTATACISREPSCTLSAPRRTRSARVIFQYGRRSRRHGGDGASAWSCSSCSGVLAGSLLALRRRHGDRAPGDGADRDAHLDRRRDRAHARPLARRARSRWPTTRSPSWRARSRACSASSTPRAARPSRCSPASASSSPTPRTSCARR